MGIRIGIGSLKIGQGSTGVDWSSYWTTRSLFFLDGTIITVGENKYFEDKSAADRHFLITGYDFATDWTVGFPYKSAATISAPADDDALIAADINNFLYAADGTPNAIPVVSLFEDVDYEHKIFCKHVAQTVDANSVELTEPYVSHVFMATDVLAGADLTKAYTDFGATAEVAGALWVGTDETYATNQLAINAAEAGNTIYSKTGLIDETTYLQLNKDVDVICTGRNVITSSGTTNVIYFNRKNASLYGALINAETDTTNGIAVNADTNAEWDIDAIRCFFMNLVTVAFNIGFGHSLNLKNTIMSRATLWTGTLYQGIIDSSYFKNGTVTFGHSNDTAPYLYNISALNSRFVNALAGSNPTFKIEIGVHSFKGNVIESNSHAITQTQRAMAVARAVEISYNQFVMKNNSSNTTIRMVDLNVTGNNKYDVNIHHNTITLTEAINAGNTVVPIYITNHLTYIESNIFNIQHANHSVIFITFSADDINRSYKINNNYIDTLTQANIAISIGGETAFVNCNNASEIIGNRVIGTNAGSSGLHGILASCGINNLITRNHISGCGFGIVVKTGDTAYAYTAGGVWGNLVRDCGEGIRVRGVAGMNVFGNTILGCTAKGVYCDENSVQAGDQFSENIIVKNNIIAGGATAILVHFDQHAADNGCTADYNVYYSANAKPFMIGATAYSFAEWQALGYDAHSTFLTAEQYAAQFPTGQYYPTTPVTGETLDAAYDDGLDVTTDWGSINEVPTVVTKQQGATWQIGAYIV